MRPGLQWARSDIGMCVQVVMVLKKEIMKTQNRELEKAAEYRHLLVHAIHECAANFPDIAANVIHLLMDFLVWPHASVPIIHAHACMSAAVKQGLEAWQQRKDWVPNR